MTRRAYRIVNKAGKCRCGVRRSRRKKFYTNDTTDITDGLIAHLEICQRAEIEISKWMQEPITCETCKPI